MGREGRSAWSWLAAVAVALPAMGCDLYKALSHPTEVRFTVDKEILHVGETLEVEFQELVGGDGRRYWLGLVPKSTPLEDHTGCSEIAPETKRAELSATSAGDHEVRVYSDRRGGTVMIVARSQVSVVP